MGRSRYKIYENYYPYFITSSCIDGISLFADTELATILLDSIDFLQKDREVTLYSYVIMHNHFHLIAIGKMLSDDVRNLKAYTAKRIIESLEARGRSYLRSEIKGANKRNRWEYQVWQEGFHPKQLFTSDIMTQKIEHIHNNPLKCGFVDVPEHWRYSSARNYAGVEGLIPVTIFEG